MELVQEVTKQTEKKQQKTSGKEDLESRVAPTYYLKCIVFNHKK